MTPMQRCMCDCIAEEIGKEMADANDEEGEKVDTENMTRPGWIPKRACSEAELSYHEQPAR